MLRGAWAAAALIGSAGSAHGHQSTNLVGTWKLVSASAVNQEGKPLPQPFGNNPAGTLTYTRDGKVSVLISHGARKLLSGDRIASPAEEKAEAFATFFAYAGTYSVRGNRITHHVLISSVPNWVGTDLVRTAKVTGNELTLTTPLMTIGGIGQITILHWRRTSTR